MISHLQIARRLQDRCLQQLLSADSQGIILMPLRLCFIDIWYHKLLVQRMKHQRNPDVLCIFVTRHEPISTYGVFIVSFSATVSQVVYLCRAWRLKVSLQAGRSQG